MKTCINCKESKSLEEFRKDSKKQDGHQSKCKECMKAWERENYKNRSIQSKEIKQEHATLRYRRNSQYILGYLQTSRCLDCGESNFVVLEFDHREDKVFNISEHNGCSLEKLQLEINKCDVRCANCHRIKTANQLGWYKNLELS